jgi:hypothetical protein
VVLVRQHQNRRTAWIWSQWHDEKVTRRAHRRH